MSLGFLGFLGFMEGTYAARDSDFYLIEGGCAWDFEIYLNLYRWERYLIYGVGVMVI